MTLRIRSNEHTGVPHLDSKGEVKRYLRTSGVPYTVLRPVAFNYSLAAYREPVVGGRLPDAREPGRERHRWSVGSRSCSPSI